MRRPRRDPPRGPHGRGRRPRSRRREAEGRTEAICRSPQRRGRAPPGCGRLSGGGRSRTCITADAFGRFGQVDAAARAAARRLGVVSARRPVRRTLPWRPTSSFAASPATRRSPGRDGPASADGRPRSTTSPRAPPSPPPAPSGTRRSGPQPTFHERGCGRTAFTAFAAPGTISSSRRQPCGLSCGRALRRVGCRTR
jgi:hypothetical protein